jgi:hypothetical protein
VSTATHVALDGSEVTISMEADLSGDPSIVGVFDVSGYQREFTAGHLELGQWAAKLGSGVKLTESYGHQRGVLRIGSRIVSNNLYDGEDRVWVGVWEGKHSSLVTQLFNLEDSSDVVSLFDAFEIRELPRPCELTLKPKDPRVVADGLPTVAKEVPNVGLLEINRITSQMLRSVPKHSGTPVRGGELFFAEAPAHFLLLGQTTSTTVVPDPGTGHDDVASRLETLTVSWKDSP